MLGGHYRPIIGRFFTLLSVMAIQSMERVDYPVGSFDYVEPVVKMKNNRLYYQRFDKQHGKHYRRSK
jgi:hypothetical protein